MDFIQAKEDEIESWLEHYLGKEQFTRGLDRIVPFLPLRELEKKFIITIGGTNGKGETAYTLGCLLAERGYHVGLWTSPHVVTIRERFIFCHEKKVQMASYSELFSHLISFLREVRKKKATLSYYEFLFCVFCRLARSVDILVLEVGLGGRWDAVNLLNPQLTALTSLSRDHEDILGRGYRRILGEKLGITRTNIPLVSNLSLKYCRQLTQSFCSSQKIPWYDLFESNLTHPSNHYSLQNKKLAFFLKNRFFNENSSLNEIDSIQIPKRPGAMEEVTLRGRRFIFKGAHNLDGVRKMVEHLKETAFEVVYLAFSKRPDVEINACLTLIRDIPTKTIVITTMEHQKKWRPPGLLHKDSFEGIEIVNDWKTHLQNSCDGLYLVAGSYYFVGEFQRVLCSEDFKSLLRR